jgi:hypothetical protein
VRLGRPAGCRTAPGVAPDAPLIVIEITVDLVALTAHGVCDSVRDRRLCGACKSEQPRRVGCEYRPPSQRLGAPWFGSCGCCYGDLGQSRSTGSFTPRGSGRLAASRTAIRWVALNAWSRFVASASFAASASPVVKFNWTARRHFRCSSHSSRCMATASVVVRTVNSRLMVVVVCPRQTSKPAPSRISRAS